MANLLGLFRLLYLYCKSPVRKSRQDHPDLEEEAQRQADGEETEYDHVGEAQDWVKGLENDIAHLERVRRSRDDASQAAIDRAIESARHWIDIINRKLNGGE